MIFSFFSFIMKLVFGFILLPLILLFLFVSLIFILASSGRGRIRIIRTRVSDEQQKKFPEGKVIDAEWEEVPNEKDKR